MANGAERPDQAGELGDVQGLDEYLGQILGGMEGGSLGRTRREIRERGDDPEDELAVLDEELGNLLHDERMVTRAGHYREGFTHGLAQGFMYPFRIFTGKPEDEIDGTLAAGFSVSKLAGEFVGMGLSFIPFWKGAQFGLRGLGLTRGMTKAGERIARGTTSVAVFEGGAAEKIEDIPARAAFGAVLGAGGEAAFLAMSRRWRAGRKSSVEGVDVDPDALRLEMAMRPNQRDDPSRVAEKLKELGDFDAQLDHATGRLAARTSGFESVLIPGIKDPQRFEQVVKGIRPDIQVHRRFIDDQWEVLLHDPTKRRPVELRSQRMSSDPEKLFEEAALIVAGGSDPIPPISVYSYSVVGELPQGLQHRVSPDWWGFHAGDVPAIGVRKGFAQELKGSGNQLRTGVEAWDRVAVLVHEYTHALHKFAFKYQALSAIFDGLPYSQVTHPGSVNPVDINFRGLVRQQLGMGATQDFTGDLLRSLPDGTMVKEIVDLAVENVAASYRLSRSEALDRAQNYVARKFDSYFGTDTEAFSWAVEAMFLFPDRARKIAPQFTKEVGEMFEALSPAMQELFKFDSRFRNIHDHLTGHWVRFGDEARFFRDYTVRLGRKQVNQWKSEGAFSGMGVLHGGEWVEYVRRIDADQIMIKFRKTGETKVVPQTSIQRPVFTKMMVNDQKLRSAVGKVMDRPLQTLALTVRNEAEPGLRRAILPLDDFARTDNLHKYMREVADRLESIPVPEAAQGLSPTEQRYVRLAELLRQDGQAGLVIDDDGLMRIFLADDNALQTGAHMISPEFQLPVDYMLPTQQRGYSIIQPSWTSQVESRLAMAGVPARDMEFFVGEALQHMGRKVQDQIDPDLWNMYRSALGRFRELTPRGKENLKAAGMKTEQTAGKQTVVKNTDEAVLARVNTDQELETVASKLTPEGFSQLDAEAPLPTEIVDSGGSLGTQPKAHSILKTMSTAEGAERASSVLQLYTSVFTAMENVAKSMEQVGLGPLYTKVYLPTQRAMTAIKNEMHVVARPELGGKTVITALQDIQKKAKKMARNRQEKVIDYIEFMTREEIASPGGFLPRGMNERELKAAVQLERLGLHTEMPRLLATDRLIRSYMHSQTRFAGAAAQLRRARDADPQLLEMLNRLESGTKELKSVSDVLDFLGLTKEERWAMKLIQDGKKLGLDKMSLPAVIRYAEAPTLPKGFKTGREWFASTQGMSSFEVSVANDIERVLDLGFNMAGLDSKRQLGGYWPHLRRMTEQGFVPTDGYLRQGIPEAMDWASARIRTGEIDVYDKDIFLTPYRYMRGLLMKQHFDPVLPEVRGILEALKTQDHRAWRIMDEYVNDLMGIPHASFKKLNQVFSGFAEAIGKTLPARTAENLVNLATSLSYGATIPFRPALIARNWFQAVQTIPARTGWESFMDGVNRALRKENFDELVKKGVIPIHQAPLHATSEVFDPRNLKMTRNMQNLVDRGFRWYKTADDFGRAMAFYAQKHRIAKWQDAVMQGQISWEDFLQRAKITTFGDADVAEFTRLWRADKFTEAADHLGAVLARETHFRYGDANRPAGWGGVTGRLFGQFGTWPVQYKDFILQGLTRGTTKDKVEFATWVATTNMGIVAAGAAVGLDLSGWVNFSSLNYTGGPYGNLAVSAVKAWGGTEQEKALARRTLTYAFPSLQHPQSIFIPGSYLLGDISSAFEQRSFAEGAIRASGFRFLEGSEEGFVSRLLF